MAEGSMPAAIIGNRSDFFVALSVVFVVVMLIVPLPTILLDFLMIINVTLSLVIILVVLYTKKALEFTIFPTMLLVSTVFGLALNVSSTRLILSQGSSFNGRIIQAFGRFVVGSSGVDGLVIGIIIFIILVAVQFFVITKGSTRVAEVAARFTLDSLPGKQMAIEAEYNSGTLTEEEMTKKKRELEREVDFYGAMDGASKFVSGNVRVGILITLVNIIGGLVIGITLRGESLEIAANTYIALTIGDGLVTQIPTLLISTATGLIVTRAVSDGSFGSDVSVQFSRQSRVYAITGIFLVALSVLPGFPWYILLPLAGLFISLSVVLSRRKTKAGTVAEVIKEKEEDAEIPIVAPLDPMSLEIGYALVPLVDKSKGAELLDRITGIRREIAIELGLVLPRIRIVDNMRLQPSEYSIKIRGVEICKATLRIGKYLAIDPGNVESKIDGEKTKEPTFGLDALWIQESERHRAERSGYTVVDAPSIITTHLTEIIRRHASEILGRQDVKQMITTLNDTYSAVVEDVNKQLSTGEIHKVLQKLLSERVSIRNLVSILEALSDFAPVSKDTEFLVEKARQSLGRQLCAQYADENNQIHVSTLDQSLEKLIIDSRVESSSGVVPVLQPSQYQALIRDVELAIQQMTKQGLYPILLCSESTRPLLRKLLQIDVNQLSILSTREIVSGYTILTVHRIRIGAEVSS